MLQALQHVQVHVGAAGQLACPAQRVLRGLGPVMADEDPALDPNRLGDVPSHAQHLFSLRRPSRLRHTSHCPGWARKTSARTGGVGRAPRSAREDLGRGVGNGEHAQDPRVVREDGGQRVQRLLDLPGEPAQVGPGLVALPPQVGHLRLQRGQPQGGSGLGLLARGLRLGEHRRAHRRAVELGRGARPVAARLVRATVAASRRTSALVDPRLGVGARLGDDVERLVLRALARLDQRVGDRVESAEDGVRLGVASTSAPARWTPVGVHGEPVVTPPRHREERPGAEQLADVGAELPDPVLLLTVAATTWSATVLPSNS